MQQLVRALLYARRAFCIGRPSFGNVPSYAFDVNACPAMKRTTRSLTIAQRATAMPAAALAAADATTVDRRVIQSGMVRCTRSVSVEALDRPRGNRVTGSTITNPRDHSQRR
eukprot:7039808-Prymnesium_polylepis.1